MFFRTRLKPFTGFIEEVAVYRFVVLFAVACICLLLAGAAGAQTFSCPAGTEDMLNYFVMNYPDRADYSWARGMRIQSIRRFPRQWIELRRDWIFCLDQRREWISVG